MMYERHLIIREVPGWLDKGLYIYTDLPDRKIQIEYEDPETGITNKKVFSGGDTIAPLLRLSPDDLQMLADELQRMNVRPREASKTEGLYQAQTEHLKDLRKLLKL